MTCVDHPAWSLVVSSRRCFVLLLLNKDAGTEKPKHRTLDVGPESA